MGGSVAEKTNETWFCPIDGLVSMKFGTTCPEFKAGYCVNEQYAHRTGQIYLNDREAKKESKSVGIAAISDE